MQQARRGQIEPGVTGEKRSGRNGGLCRALKRRDASFPLFFVLAGLCFPCAAFAKRNLSVQNQIELIRGLDREIAVAKVALPLGKHGIYINNKGEIEQEKAQAELRTKGVAVSPGMPVEITKMRFSPTAILFEINGGGKTHKKWYQHIQIGIGGATQPIVQTNQPPARAEGSYVTLKFPQGVPAELSVAQAKQLLASALDFNRQSPTLLYSPSVPPKVKQAIKNHEVLVGMDRDAVLSAKGPPDRKDRTIVDGEVTKEQWIYGLPPHVLFVTFEGDTVVAVHQY